MDSVETPIDNWDAATGRFRPAGGKRTARVTVDAQKTPRKETVVKTAKLNGLKVAGWYQTGFMYVGKIVRQPEIWGIDDKEAKDLGSPTADVINALPEKWRAVFGIEKVERFALVFAVLELANAVNHSVAPRIRDTRIASMPESNMSDAEFGAEFAHHMNGVFENAASQTG